MGTKVDNKVRGSNVEDLSIVHGLNLIDKSCDVGP